MIARKNVKFAKGGDIDGKKINYQVKKISCHVETRDRESTPINACLIIHKEYIQNKLDKKPYKSFLDYSEK